MKLMSNRIILKFYTITLMAMLITLLSCEEFLTEKPKSFFEQSNYYVDEASLKSGLLGVYHGYYRLFRDLNTAFIGELGTDEAVCLPYAQFINAMQKYSAKSDFAYYKVWYDFHFESIGRANSIINLAPEVENTSEEFVSTVIEESKVLRAWLYFRLVQTVGPVPLVDKPFGAPDFSVARAPVSDIYNLIVNDLSNAIESGDLLQEKSELEPGRITQDIAVAMLGKVYLTMAAGKENGVLDRLMEKVGKSGYGYSAISKSSQELYEEAAITFKPLLSKYELHPEYGELFCTENKNIISENMWEIQFSDFPGEGSGWQRRLGAKTDLAAEELTYWSNGLGWTQIMYSTYIWQLSTKQDKRTLWNMTDSIYLAVANGVYGGVYLGFDPFDAVTNEDYHSWCGVTKYRHSFKDPLHEVYDFTGGYNDQGYNTILMRFADVLLSYAEAEIGVNGGVATAEAVEAVNRVRNRARGSEVTESETPEFPNFSIGTLTPDSLLQERMFEFCFENTRRFDLVRTGKLIEQYYKPESIGQYEHGIITEDNYLLPIPQDQINVSINKVGFFQNPGY